ncbi:PAS/PAC sensor signal transduction histidine kinase [Geotalea uraniireducens Rf4]|uniref:Oxygen sensor histidine kinase NreB n=2 Tax=Geotalea uraniireducens TaxID=351604 RepID=A5G589_GEOUR|nr:PAS/PAC sensor signal transduction histidine kinase [Geotalea uraniireducens Rf4]
MDCKYLTGDHWHAMALVRDIDERKCAKEQLLKREREFRTLAENSPDVIVRYDRECRRIYVNPTFERVNRLSSNEVLGKSPVELSTELAPMAVSFTQRLKEVMETGVATQIDLIWTKDGMENCWFVRAIPEFDANGEVVSALTIWCDITERKRAEEALKEQYSILRSIIDSANALVFSVDRQYRYTSFNKGHAVAMQAIYGAEIEIGQCLLDYMTVTADREIAKRNLDRALAGEQLMEEAYSGEELRTRKYFHVSHSPINTETGDVIGVAVLAQDMTERKRAEEALRAKQQRLSDMTVELSLAEERERRRIAAELHDNIGQDLVLARIKLGMLAKMPLTDEEAGILGNTREILGGMIQRVRFLTHMISPPILESGGLEAALKWLGRQMETDYGLRVSFVDDTSEKPLTEEMRSVLYHAVRELLINVAKHAESDTALVAVGRECGRIVIRVEDDGIGFDPDAIEESLTRKGGGFGLFNIRRRIIHLGGAFDVESSPGAGTCVTIGMPLTKNNDEL